MPLARAAHELRTPLHGILGAAELLRAGALDDAQREHVATIEEAARALLRVAEDALAAAAVAGGGPAPGEPLGNAPARAPRLAAVRAPCDPRAVVEGVARLLAPAARARGLALDTAVEASVPRSVATDAGRLRQLLVNLAGNAVKFTAAGGVTLAARAATAAEAVAVGGGDALTLEVRDTGPGLPTGARAALDGADVRPSVPGARPGGGAGLGLSIVAELVDALGGALHAASDGAGTTFRVTIPAPALPPMPDADVAAPAAVRAGTRVLVVDDDPVSRRVTAALLAALGCDVAAAGDAGAALALAARRPHDLVLLDLQLADADGRDVAIALRDHETAVGRAPTPLVAVTAHADPALRARCAAAGIAECLVKPVGRAALGAAVVRWARGATSDGVLDPALDPALDSPLDSPLDPGAVARLRDLELDAPGLLARVAADYAASAARRLDEIERAFAAGEGESLARAAHALRGASASAGAARAAALAGAVTRAGAGASAVRELRAEVGRAAAALAALAAPAAHGATPRAAPAPSPARHTPAQPGASMCRYCDTERPRAGSPPVPLIPPGSST